MVRECGACEHYARTTRTGAVSSVGWCTFNGQAVKSTQSCRFYVRAPGAVKQLDTFDPNVSLRVMERRAAGNLPAFKANPAPPPAPLDAMRQKVKRRRVA